MFNIHKYNIYRYKVHNINMCFRCMYYTYCITSIPLKLFLKSNNICLYPDDRTENKSSWDVP